MSLKKLIFNNQSCTLKKVVEIDPNNRRINLTIFMIELKFNIGFDH